MIIKEQANIKLSTLSQKKDEDFHLYYYLIETLLIGILGKDQLTYNKENAIMLNSAEQHISKNTIAKFGFGL